MIVHRYSIPLADPEVVDGMPYVGANRDVGAEAAAKDTTTTLWFEQVPQIASEAREQLLRGGRKTPYRFNTRESRAVTKYGPENGKSFIGWSQEHFQGVVL